MLRVIVTLLAIWIALNLLFVMIVIPPRKHLDLYGQKGDSSADHRRQQEEDHPRPWQSILSAGRGALFSLTPIFAAAIDAMKRLLKKRRE